MDGDCDNCARAADDLRAVRRVYLLPAPTALAAVERWCGACRSQYPCDEEPTRS